MSTGGGETRISVLIFPACRSRRNVVPRAVVLAGAFVGIALLMTLAAGCSNSGSTGGSAVIEGKVTLNGNPLKSGKIQFIPLGRGQGNAVMAAIEEGKYRAEHLSPGSYSVLISASQSTGKMRKEHGLDMPETVSLIPAKYATGFEIKIANNFETKDFNL